MPEWSYRSPLSLTFMRNGPASHRGRTSHAWQRILTSSLVHVSSRFHDAGHWQCEQHRRQVFRPAVRSARHATAG